VTVLRIVPNFQADDPQQQARFYADLFGVDVVMDQGFIVNLASEESMRPQLSLMTHGGAGTEVPVISIEVDDVEDAHARAMSAGHDIVYPLTSEPWGVRRFYVRDPGGRTVNVLMHEK
jgi:predicted enzyme related to lactoylglutathione lyase